jgi:hypothetical protein
MGWTASKDFKDGQNRGCHFTDQRLVRPAEIQGQAHFSIYGSSLEASRAFQIRDFSNCSICSLGGEAGEN